jgi:hypothetical protein
VIQLLQDAEADTKMQQEAEACSHAPRICDFWPPARDGAVFFEFFEPGVVSDGLQHPLGPMISQTEGE